MYGNILNFSLTGQINCMVLKIRCSDQFGQKPPKPLFPLEAPELLSTRMPNLTPLTTPNDILIGSQTSAQLCITCSIGFNGTPNCTPPKNCPFPFDYHHPIYTPIPVDPTHQPKRHPDPISHFAIDHFPDRLRGRQTYRQMG